MRKSLTASNPLSLLARLAPEPSAAQSRTLAVYDASLTWATYFTSDAVTRFASSMASLDVGPLALTRKSELLGIGAAETRPAIVLTGTSSCAATGRRTSVASTARL